MSGERLPVWEDTNIVEAMKERPLDDIAVLNCPACGRISYYSHGSWFTCPDCDRSWFVLSEDERIPPNMSGDNCMRPDCLLTLDDVLEAECSDYP